MSDVETVEYRVRRRDCLEHIVAQAGFPARDWRRIYNANYNRRLRRQRPDPNHIEPGDIVVLPRYTARQLTDILNQINTVKNRMTRLGRGLTETENRIERIERAATKDAANWNNHITELRQEINRLDSLVNDATGECEDEWSCMGAGAAAQNMINRAREMQRQQSQLERERDVAADRVARTLRGLRQSLAQLHRAYDSASGEVERQSRTYTRNARNPY